MNLEDLDSLDEESLEAITLYIKSVEYRRLAIAKLPAPQPIQHAVPQIPSRPVILPAEQEIAPEPIFDPEPEPPAPEELLGPQPRDSRVTAPAHDEVWPCPDCKNEYNSFGKLNLHALTVHQKRAPGGVQRMTAVRTVTVRNFPPKPVPVVPVSSVRENPRSQSEQDYLGF